MFSLPFGPARNMLRVVASICGETLRGLSAPTRSAGKRARLVFIHPNESHEGGESEAIHFYNPLAYAFGVASLKNRLSCPAELKTCNKEQPEWLGWFGAISFRICSMCGILP